MTLLMQGRDSMSVRWPDLPRCQFSGRQDKSADHGRAYVLGCVRFFALLSNLACWHLRHKVQGIQCSESHPGRFGRHMLP